MGIHEYSVTLQHAHRKCCRMHTLYTFPSVRDALGRGNNWKFGPFAFAGGLCRQLAVPQCTGFESSHRLCATSDSRLCRNMHLDDPPYSALLQILMLQMVFLVQMLLFKLLQGTSRTSMNSSSCAADAAALARQACLALAAGNMSDGQMWCMLAMQHTSMYSRQE